MSHSACLRRCAQALLIVTSVVAVAQAQTEGFPDVSPIPDFNAARPPATTVESRFPSSGPPIRPLVLDVRFVGNKAIREEKMQSLCKTRRDREFDPEQLKADVRKMMNSGLFRVVNPTTEPTREGVIVTLEVEERPLIRHIKFIGNRGLSDSKLRKEAGIKIHDPLNQYAVEEARRKIEEFYRSRGYAKAQVSILEGKGPNDTGVVLNIAEGYLVRIAKVEFVGNTIASDGRLKTQIESKPGILWLFRGKLDLEKLDQDNEKLLAYYRSLGFFRARLDRILTEDDSGKWATLTFVVDEGPRYIVRDVSVAGNVKFSGEDLMGKMELLSGNYFNQAKMNRDVEQLRDIYGGQGHIFADVKADPVFLEEPGQLDLVYHIDEGEQFRAGKINVEIGGDYPHTRDMVVLNRLSVTPGEILDIREIRASERRLKSAQLFEDEQSGGKPPQVVVRTPDMDNIRGLANKPKNRTSRGQSPD